MSEDIAAANTPKSDDRPVTIPSRDFSKNNLAGYLFISPWLLAFFFFTLIPMVISFVLMFTDYDILGDNVLRGDFGRWVGFENFNRMFLEDARYGHSINATLKYVVFAVPMRLVFALAVAMLLNTKRRGVYLYRAAYYIPSVIGGSVAVAVMWRQLFGNKGLINGVLGLFDVEAVRWLGNPDTAIWTLIVLAMWQFGSPMLIFLAGLRQIPETLYEAADIDGANGWNKFTRITLPLLTPIIFFNLIMQMIAGFKVFTQAFIITSSGSIRGAPLDTTLFYSVYLYTRAFETFEMGYASAMAWVLLAIIGIMTAISFKLSAYWVYYETDMG